ncbi:hypothetical protein ACQKGO_11885 [Corallococcus interemptor]|uniref:hypothetical protein n=1 Tax=Corallococcus interemptor TaxID=2316720 RepID=UPI003D023CE1
MISERSFSSSFNSFWHDLLPLLTPHYVSRFNIIHENHLADANGDKLPLLPVGEDVEHADFAAEYAFQLARLANQADIPLLAISLRQDLLDDAYRIAAGLISKYSKKNVQYGLKSSDIQEEALQLLRRYDILYAQFPSSPIAFNPALKGSGFLNSCEGDISIGTCLIEVKTTVRRPSSRDFRQIITYLALDSNSGSRRWSHIGLFNPRRGTVHATPVDSWISRLSGGRTPLDVFSEIISFTQANDVIVDTKF